MEFDRGGGSGWGTRVQYIWRVRATESSQIEEVPWSAKARCGMAWSGGMMY